MSPSSEEIMTDFDQRSQDMFLEKFSSSRRRLSRRGLSVFVLIAVIGVTGVLAALAEFEMGEIARVTWFFAGGLALLLIWYVNRVTRLDWLSSPLSYAIVFWVFHFGLVFPASIAPSLLEGYDPWNIDWLYNPETGRAVLVSLLFLASFLLGAVVLSRSGTAGPRSEGPSVPRADELALAGKIIVVLAVIIFGLALLRHGVSVLFQSYGEFFQIHTDFSWSVVVASFGLILQLAGGTPPKTVLRILVFTYLPLAALTFIAGARTAPLFCAVVLGVAFAKRGLRISYAGLWIALVVIFLAIGLVRQTRQYGLIELIQGDEAVATIESPIAGMTEVGGSLRPVSATVHYIDTAGHEMFWGGTYLYPIIRQVEAILGIARGDPDTEPRFIATHISILYGAAMGYSVVAEGYVNGGIVGVVGFALLWGLLLAYLDNRSASAYGLAILGSVLLPMMISIRNSFIFVPAWISLAGLVLIIARYVLRGMIRGSLRPRPIGAKHDSKGMQPP
jgi:hypothetical protein